MFIIYSFIVLVLFLRLARATASVHDDTFTPHIILRGTVQSVSQACINRLSVLINGTCPGPEIRLREGKTTWIRVYNDMNDRNLTMHWHGLAQAASPFSDGTPQASQWPIGPLHFFDYEIHPQAGDAGTYFYHSHVGFQAVSAAGPLIVEDAHRGPYTYKDERTFFLSDLFNKTDSQIQKGLESDPFVWSGETSTVLVNGLGITVNGTKTGPSCSLSITNVEPDTVYRFRFIGATALSLVSLAFEGHPELKVIEADGRYTKPYSTSYLQIGSGQRYSVLFKTKSLAEVRTDQTGGRSAYYLQLETLERPTLTRAYALLAYPNQRKQGNTTVAITTTIPDPKPLTLPNITTGFLDYQLRPLNPNEFPPLSEVTRRVTITVQQIVNGTITWAQNGLPWFESYPKVPYLVSLYEDLYTADSPHSPSYTDAIANGGMDNTTRTFPAQIGEVLEIVIQNSGATNGGLDVHPFHAHGMHFWDLGSGNGTYDLAANEAKLVGTQPVVRDTTMLYRYGTKTTPGLNAGWRAWRLRATQAGVWMIHCHTLQHMIMGKKNPSSPLLPFVDIQIRKAPRRNMHGADLAGCTAGMQTVWVFGNEEEIRKIPYPDIGGYLTYGGSAYGNESWAPVVNHYFDETG
ncbi:MAG: hypothetical protein Q9187_007359 [Circinaria calcarea]